MVLFAWPSTYIVKGRRRTCFLFFVFSLSIAPKPLGTTQVIKNRRPPESKRQNHASPTSHFHQHDPILAAQVSASFGASGRHIGKNCPFLAVFLVAILTLERGDVQQEEFDKAWRTATAVSYTHLTLPTICSV